MPGCAAFGCSNRDSKGFVMKVFPRDPTRRAIWTAKVRRKDWQPTNTSYLCEKHFEWDQWENKRADGKRMLKPNAIPTIFPNSKRSKKVPKTKEIVVETPEVSTGNIQETALPLSSETSGPNASNGADGKRKLKPNAIPTIFPSSKRSKSSKKVPKTKEIVVETSEVSTGNSVETASQLLSETSGSNASNGAPQKETEASVAATESQVPSRQVAEAEVWKHPSNGKDLKKLCDRLQETVNSLRRKLVERRKVIVKLRRELECARDIRKVFNEDQVQALRVRNGRGARWSEQTIEQGLRLEMACGRRGYAALLALNYPLPSARTLRKKRQQMNLNND